MRRIILTGAVILVLTIALLTGLTGCFLSSNNNSTQTTTPIVVKPAPEVVSVVASTSGTHDGYFTTLDIKVKNNGAEGTILVEATVTQSGTVSPTRTMEVFLKQNETHELKLTFQLAWLGGDFTSNVETIVP